MKKKLWKWPVHWSFSELFYLFFFVPPPPPPPPPTLKLKKIPVNQLIKKIWPQSYFSHCKQYPRGRERRDIMQKRNTVQSLYKTPFYNMDLGKTQSCVMLWFPWLFNHGILQMKWKKMTISFHGDFTVVSMGFNHGILLMNWRKMTISFHRDFPLNTL